MAYLLEGYNALSLELADGRKAVLVADLHIGYESELAGKGIRVPPMHRKLAEKLIEAVEACGADVVYLLGDVKHYFLGFTQADAEHVREFVEAVGRVSEVVIVQGNHDGKITEIVPEWVKVYDSRGVAVEVSGGKKMCLIHGHARPRKSDLEACDAIVMGHLHPRVLLQDPTGLRYWEPAIVKAKTTLSKLMKHLYSQEPEEDREITIIVLPAFNPILGGTDVRQVLNPPEKEYRTQILSPDTVEPRDVEVYLTDGTFIGTVETLQSHGFEDVESVEPE